MTLVVLSLVFAFMAGIDGDLGWALIFTLTAFAVAKLAGLQL